MLTKTGETYSDYLPLYKGTSVGQVVRTDHVLRIENNKECETIMAQYGEVWES